MSDLSDKTETKTFEEIDAEAKRTQAEWRLELNDHSLRCSHTNWQP